MFRLENNLRVRHWGLAKVRVADFFERCSSSRGIIPTRGRLWDDANDGDGDGDGHENLRVEDPSFSASFVIHHASLTLTLDLGT